MKVLTKGKDDDRKEVGILYVSRVNIINNVDGML